MNADQSGFGGNAQQVDQEVTNNQFEASMSNFMDAHKSTQSVLSNLTEPTPVSQSPSLNSIRKCK